MHFIFSSLITLLKLYWKALIIVIALLKLCLKPLVPVVTLLKQCLTDAFEYSTICSLDSFQIYHIVAMLCYKHCCKNTTHIFIINLIYHFKTCKTRNGYELEWVVLLHPFFFFFFFFFVMMQIWKFCIFLITQFFIIMMRKYMGFFFLFSCNLIRTKPKDLPNVPLGFSKMMKVNVIPKAVKSFNDRQVQSLKLDSAWLKWTLTMYDILKCCKIWSQLGPALNKKTNKLVIV